MPPHILARLVAPLALAVLVALAADPPVDCELSHYLVLGLQPTRLKSRTI